MDTTSILNDVVIPIIVALVGAFGTTVLALGAAYLKRKIGSTKLAESEKAALSYLVDGVEKSGEEYVHLIKKAAADKKLSPEERAEARDIAIKHAKEIATGEGAKILAEASSERLGAWIKQILKAQKKG
jgi:hypothetical protein